MWLIGRMGKKGMTSYGKYLGSLADWQIAQVPGTVGSLLGGVIMCLLFVLGGMYVCVSLLCSSSFLEKVKYTQLGSIIDRNSSVDYYSLGRKP